MHYHLSTGALAAVALLTLPPGGPAGNDRVQNEFKADLMGGAERPAAVQTLASGTATITINEADSTITFSIVVTNLVNPTAAHIHLGGVDTTGPAAVGLLLNPPAAGTINGKLASGSFGPAEITGGVTFKTLVAHIRKGEAYVNVHTTAYPGGEIRGQLVPD